MIRSKADSYCTISPGHAPQLWFLTHSLALIHHLRPPSLGFGHELGNAFFMGIWTIWREKKIVTETRAKRSICSRTANHLRASLLALPGCYAPMESGRPRATKRRSQRDRALSRQTRCRGLCLREGFCLSTHVLATVPTSPNRATYGVFLYQTCTFSVPFRRKTGRNRPLDGGPESSSRAAAGR
jgi:hypothetical protein